MLSGWVTGRRRGLHGLIFNIRGVYIGGPEDDYFTACYCFTIDSYQESNECQGEEDASMAYLWYRKLFDGRS